MTQINLFHNAKDIQDFNAGEVIFTEGEVGDYMYDVVEGEVELLYHDQLIHTLSKGEIFGEMGLISGEGHSATARARSACKIAKISRRRFLFMVEQTPNFALRVMQIMAERLRRETRRHFQPAQSAVD